MTKILNRAVGIGSARYPQAKPTSYEAPPQPDKLDAIIESATRKLATKKQDTAEATTRLAQRKLWSQLAGVPESDVWKLRHAEP